MRFSVPDDLPALRAWCELPEIRQSLEVVREADLQVSSAQRAASFALIDDDGCIVAECLFPGRFVLYTNLLRKARGRVGHARLAAAVGKMFVSRTGADFLFVPVPRDDRASVSALCRLGFARSFDLARDPGNESQPFSVYHLALQDWVVQGFCVATGRRVEAEIQRQLGRSQHQDDASRMAVLGAAAEMIAVQNVDKAIEVFNAWARFAGRTPIRLLSTDPVRIDVGACVVRFSAADVHVEEVFHA